MDKILGPRLATGYYIMSTGQFTGFEELPPEGRYRYFRRTLLEEEREVRVTDPKTGGQKGSKLERFDLIPVEALRELAKVFGAGAKKYEDRNWERGYRWGLSYAALQRHAWAWWNREEIDAETGRSHIMMAAWHCMVLFTFKLSGLGLDDRPEKWEDDPDGGNRQ